MFAGDMTFRWPDAPQEVSRRTLLKKQGVRIPDALSLLFRDRNVLIARAAQKSLPKAPSP